MGKKHTKTTRGRHSATARRHDTASIAVEPAPATGGWRNRLQRYGPWLLLTVVLVLVALVRWRLAGVPFERDEGEYAYAGQLILQGFPPYELAYNMKFPGTYYAYALIMQVFGETIPGVHIGLLVLNLLTALLLFVLIRRFFGGLPAAVGASGFAILALDRWIMGIFAHATHFVLLPALAGLLLLLKYMDTRNRSWLVGAGALFGIAVLMKQHAAVYPLFAACILLWDGWKREPPRLRRTVASESLLLAGALLPLALLAALLAANGVLGRFWFWTFQYAAAYVSQTTLPNAWDNFVLGWMTVTLANLWLWLFAGFGYLVLWLVRWPLATRLFVSGLLLFSLLGMLPGFFFRPHYFILLLPAAGFGIAAAVASIVREFRRYLPGVLATAVSLALFALVVVPYAYGERAYLLRMTPEAISRARYGPNPFIESLEIARYLKQHTEPQDRIAVLGSEPQIYFYSDRKSATGYIYTYAMMETQQYAARMQAEFMDEIEQAHPEYLVLVDVQGSWTANSKSDSRVIFWMSRYWRQCYDAVGVADIISASQTVYRWGPKAAAYSPKSDYRVFTLRRKSAEPCAAPRD